jgi:hypothetical protein
MGNISCITSQHHHVVQPLMPVLPVREASQWGEPPQWVASQREAGVHDQVALQQQQEGGEGRPSTRATGGLPAGLHIQCDGSSLG